MGVWIGHGDEPRGRDTVSGRPEVDALLGKS